MGYATVGDVELDQGQPVPDASRPHVQYQLDKAEEYLRALVPDLDARVSDGRITADRVRTVVVSMTVRVLQNLGGITSETRQIGPFSQTRQLGSRSGQLVLTKAERRLLGLRSGGATSMSLDDDVALSRVMTPPLLDPDRPRDPTGYRPYRSGWPGC